MKAIIVDDERLARREIAYLLSAFENVQVLGEFSNVDAALTGVEKFNPDLIFLDINMPEKNGFDLVEEIEDETIQVIFTTAYNQHAIKAFEHNALDYLLKPITPERLKIAIERAEKTIDLLGKDKPELSVSDPLKVKVGELVHEIAITDVILFESYGNYVKLHLDSQTILHHISLNALESILDRSKFFRANRYTLVPLDKVVKVTKHSRSKICLEMINNMKVICSERKTVAFRKLR